MNNKKYLPLTSFKIDCIEEGNDDDGDSICISYGGTSRSLPYCIMQILINDIYDIKMRVEMETLKDIKKRIKNFNEIHCENSDNNEIYLKFNNDNISITSETKIFKTNIIFERNKIVEESLQSFLNFKTS